MRTGPQRYTDAQLVVAVSNSRTMREVLTALGLAPRGGNYETVWRRIGLLRLDVSHFQMHGKQTLRPYSDEEILPAVKISRSFAQVLSTLGIKQGGGIQSSLKRRVEALGIDISHFSGRAWRKGCRLEVWNDAPIPLELDHINGRRDDNRLTNLRLLCPNCHAQTPTYRGRNIGAANRLFLGEARVPEYGQTAVS
jgi:hypothetical protein